MLYGGNASEREIDTREKMNLPFRYEAENDNGSQLFINILLKSILDSQVVAFDPIDDRFNHAYEH